jgi:CheY-like chemotaxis protein
MFFQPMARRPLLHERGAPRSHTLATEPRAHAVAALASAPQILVAEADDDTRALYTQSFALVGCDVMEASDGREALAIGLVRPLNLVVTEIKLPLVDGFAPCES